ncbi:MAG: 8-oxo-dGTP diphosphatase [Clostridia bacterium]|nr:8-oxo-dGTP diphosphatase [Clostridia bacterium]MBO7169886.1 8-oxo-dGTP diphosphatase [Clostridia bacterium]
MQNTTLCYLEKDGKMLMLHRVKEKEDINAGKFLGVGGHFEEGESPYDCAIREIFEETGLAVAALRYRGVVTFVSDRYESEQMHLFSSDAFLGEDAFPDYDPSGVRDGGFCDEGVLCWVDKKEMFSLPMWEGDEVFLRLMEKGEPFFSLKLIYEGDALVSKVLNGIVM